jgi:hypothetical protein
MFNPDYLIWRFDWDTVVLNEGIIFEKKLTFLLIFVSQIKIKLQQNRIERNTKSAYKNRENQINLFHNCECVCVCLYVNVYVYLMLNLKCILLMIYAFSFESLECLRLNNNKKKKKKIMIFLLLLFVN